MVKALMSGPALCLTCWAALAGGANDTTVNFGPYNVSVLEGGVGLSRELSREAGLLAAGAPWSISGWLHLSRVQPEPVLIAAIGDYPGEWRGLLLRNGILVLSAAPGVEFAAAAPLDAGRWYAVAAVYDGARAALFLDGRELAAGTAVTRAVAARLALAPVTSRGDAAGVAAGGSAHFGGALAGFTVSPAALDAARLRELAATRPDFSLVTFNQPGVGWPWQEHAWRGLQEPQDPWTLPHGLTPPGVPVARPAPAPSRELQRTGGQTWSLEDWRLQAAPAVEGGGETLSMTGYGDRDWFPAVVPGTVLTTLIERGVYPDPDYGLNNLAIPDSLSRQDYWYRTEFQAPVGIERRGLTLTFKGINYSAEIWLNGMRLGTIKGAFVRGVFDVTGKLRAGSNAVAVRISPPPHPGIPHEQSVMAGPGMNGGAMAIDGPTFIASEGWDWIPGIRDRNSGLWQGVELRACGPLRLLDPHVTTLLPLPATDSADVTIVVPIENRSPSTVAATLTAGFGGVVVRKFLAVGPGVTEVALRPDAFPQLHVLHPRLWWPNGYGEANLQTLRLDVAADGAPSDSATVRFGFRQITYELSLFDHDGRLQRVEVDPTAGSARGERLVDVRHEAIKRSPQGWAESLTAAGEHSAAVHPVNTGSLTPYLAIRVNGVPIAARGGSWGMDDSRKRIERAHLEPFFRLHRAANLDIIRNWLGQNTEDVFYDLADEYGLLVLNDFWISTQDFQVEPQDPALFLANARDVISRYRNHPSIAVWFGRNEGVPQPIINEGLADLVATLDGSRYYTGSSNSVNLQGSGPYNYRPPEEYFTRLAQGFSVEVGTPSLSTLESLRASIPEADRWPLGDTYAYHDWHFGGNGDVATFMAALAGQYGAGTGLEDFERKAQLMDYVSYRAIFEGFQAHLWSGNSGRLLWMTHPSWPSNTWQIYSSDYDTAAAYYGVKKACEPLHAQLDLPDFAPAVVNTTRSGRRGLTLRIRVLSLDNRELLTRTERLDSAANSVSTRAPLDLGPLLRRERLVLVKLVLSEAGGAVLSDNLYWQSGDAAGQQRLNELAPQPVDISARAHRDGDDTLVDVRLTNRGGSAAVTAKITALDAGGMRVLPVYYSDNYVTLLPGESRGIELRCPAGPRCAKVGLRGWNVVAREAVVK